MSTPALTPDELRAQIALVLETAAPQGCFEPEAIDELLEKFNIYHQELEYQNEELKRISSDLEKTRLHLKDLYENAPVAYLTCDENLGILSANRAFRDLLGVAPEEPLKTPWNSYLTPSSQDQFYFHQKALRERGVAPPCYVEVVRQGKTLHLKLESNRQSDNPPFEYRSTLTDLTREFEIEADLRLSQSRFSEVVGKATDGILVLDKSSRILVWNQRMEEITGLLAVESMGRFLWEVQYELALEGERLPGSAEQVQMQLMSFFRALEQGAPPTSWERPIRRRDGTQRWVGSTVFLLQAERETLFGCIFRDLTTERQMQHDLAQAKKTEAIGLLAGGIAHDFNNLLGIIFGRLELAKLRPGLTPELTTDLAQIETAARHSAEMTKQLLTYARKQAVQAQEIDLNAVITDLLPILKRLGGDSVEILPQLTADLPLVLMDPSQLEQILTNLTTNARDAIKGLGVIKLGTEWESSGTRVVLTVEDTGSGMDQATQNRLFEPFFTTKKLGHGTGLGLATVHGIVYQNHGEIQVSSVVGQGTRFSIFLPMYRSTRTQKATPSPQNKAPSTQVYRILVVDDEPDILEFVSMALRLWGHQVWSAASAEQALELLQPSEGAIELLVTDVMLPGMNGKDLATKVLTTIAGIQVLYMSGFSGDLIAEHGVFTHPTHFLQKPFDLNQLKEQIDSFQPSEIR